jgi:hypothetical protein
MGHAMGHGSYEASESLALVFARGSNYLKNSTLEVMGLRWPNGFDGGERALTIRDRRFAENSACGGVGVTTVFDQ